MHKEIHFNKTINMATENLGAGEGDNHRLAREILYDVLLRSGIDTKIVWEDNGMKRQHIIKWDDYDSVGTESPIGDIRPDITLYNREEEPIYFFEICVTNPVDPEKEEKIRNLKMIYGSLRVFELTYDMIRNMFIDIVNRVQRGGGTYHILHAEREII